ncbi:hypothetical protein ACK3Y5_00820 [Aeromonas caviae]
MAGLWPRTGNVTVTNGSKIVTGFGTKWKTGTLPIQKGHTFYGPDNFAYEVDTVVSDESLTLVEAYRGGTLANQGYRIDITRTSTISQFAADLASLVAKYRAWFDGMMTWLTGSGDVAILNPDTGANVTIPSWKKVASEGEGQAARAKTEADKAAASAALAGDIVAASALPLPDVWAPLSDSLRLITGYGRDVLVGSDVVARMVNFSRSTTATYIGKDGLLKTAAANEPRFEKEGLLLEGKSTNLIARSEGISMSNPGGSNTVVQNNIADFLPGFLCVRVTFNNPTASNGDHIRVNPSVQAGKTYTWSIVTDSPDRRVFVYTPGPGVIQNSVFSVTKISERLWRQANTFTLSSAFVPGTDYFDVRITAGSTVAGTVVNAGAIQLEELPFASSYIPTNGAAVTRAADQAWLPAAGNRFIGGLYAAAFEFDLLGRVTGAGFSRLVDFDNSGGSDRQHISITENGQLQCVMGPSQTAASVTGKLAGRAAMRMSNFALNVMMDGVASSSVTAAGGGFPANNRIVLMNANLFNLPSYGHIRNLRMWSKHPISNDQLRTAV